MLSPGPANLVSLVLSSRYGLRQVVPFQCGILLVYAVIGFAMAATAARLGDSFRSAAVFMQIAGGLFVFYLGIRLILTKTSSGEAGDVPTFRSGVLLQIFNPKFPPVVLTVLSARSATNPLVVVAIVVSVGAIGLMMYSLTGSSIHRFASADRHLRMLNVVFGVLLCLVGAWIATGALAW